MPLSKEVWEHTDLRNIPEYFCALQAIFDVVKYQARNNNYVVERNLLERSLKEYLEDKEWNRLISFFSPYANQIMDTIKDLKYKFGDGRLVKSVEDVMLAGLLKNYVQYDYVVGNPPYVRIQTIGKFTKEHYKSIYESATGRFDLYVLFIERGIKWMTTNGTLGYITSNKFFNSAYGRGIRKSIYNQSTVEQIIDFGDSGVFKDVTNYPTIFVLRRDQGHTNAFSFVKVVKEYENILEHILNNLSDHDYSDEILSHSRIDLSELSKSCWDITTPIDSHVLKKIETISDIRVDKIIEGSSVGIFTGYDRAYIVDEETATKYNLEKDLLKPLYRGKDVERWIIRWQGEYIIYPYIKRMTVQIEDFPNIMKYLERYKQELLNRESFGKIFRDTNKNWFEMWHPNFSMTEPKILTPDITNSQDFAIDEFGTCICLKTIMILVLRDSYRKSMKFLLGLLNSNALEFYYKHISPSVRGKYYRYWRTYLERLPIRLPQTEEEQKLAEQISNKVESILSQVKIEQGIENFPKRYLEIRRGIELNEKTYTFKRNHDTLEPTTTELEGGGYKIAFGRKEDVISIETKARAEYLFTTLRGKKVKKAEKIKILIPRDERKVKEILEEYKNDKKRLEELPISKLENEVNELVYELYGLDESDRKVIEEFLEKF